MYMEGSSCPAIGALQCHVINSRHCIIPVEMEMVVSIVLRSAAKSIEMRRVGLDGVL